MDTKKNPKSRARSVHFTLDFGFNGVSVNFRFCGAGSFSPSLSYGRRAEEREGEGDSQRESEGGKRGDGMVP